MADIGSVVGTGEESSGRGVNGTGQFVGSSTFVNSAGFLHAFIYSDGAAIDLGTFGGTSSSANAINASGVVAGEARDATGLDLAFLYSNGIMTNLGSLGGSSSALAINDSGQVTGGSQLGLTDYVEHAFLCTAGSPMKDLGTLGGSVSRGTGINASGQVVGFSSVSGVIYHPFLYSNGVMHDLGTFGTGDTGDAIAINDFGQVVGSSNFRPGSSTTAAFLYSNGVMVDLNTKIPTGTGWTLQEGYGINNSGQIIGTGIFHGQTEHAFLLTPIPAPEPSTLALSAFGFLALAWRLRRRA